MFGGMVGGLAVTLMKVDAPLPDKTPYLVIVVGVGFIFSMVLKMLEEHEQ